ncbi:MAG TPA: hypothetical protein DDW17_08000 [Deltaproteobacteria bacterium]|nr:hypothetical protein [Deltaproteobacteria bacterium]
MDSDRCSVVGEEAIKNKKAKGKKMIKDSKNKKNKKDKKDDSRAKCYVCGRVLLKEKMQNCGKEVYRCKKHRTATILRANGNTVKHF